MALFQMLIPWLVYYTGTKSVEQKRSVTCEVAEETEGEGEAGGVRRLQGRFSVT